MRPSGAPAELQHRRERAIKLLEEGYQPVEVAERVGVDRRSVRRWKAAYLRRGAKGIRAKPAPGRPWKMDSRSRKRLERLLLKGAQAVGYSTDLWTCPRVVAVIRRHFGVSYHVDHVGRILRALGWTPQKPERRARERDEARILGWIKNDWPRIKKGARV